VVLESLTGEALADWGLLGISIVIDQWKLSMGPTKLIPNQAGVAF
jgi:hypothetical protein